MWRDHVMAHVAVLFADHQVLRKTARPAAGEFDGGGLTTVLLVCCLFFVGVWAAARLFGDRRGRSTTNSSRRLFHELCRAHRLTRRDGWLLARLARHHRLTDPTLLFLQPRWLDSAVCGAAWQRHAPRLRGLRATLFAGLLPGETSAH